MPRGGGGGGGGGGGDLGVPLMAGLQRGGSERVLARPRRRRPRADRRLGRMMTLRGADVFGQRTPLSAQEELRESDEEEEEADKAAAAATAAGEQCPSKADGAAGRAGDDKVMRLLAGDEDLYEYFVSMWPVRRLLRVLGMWSPPGASAFERLVYRNVVAVLVVCAPVAHHFLRGEGATVAGSRNNLTLFLLQALTLLAIVVGRRYFASSHIFLVLRSVFSDTRDPYSPTLSPEDRATRREAKVAEFRRLVRGYVRVFLLQLALSFVCYVVLLSLRRTDARNLALAATLDALALTASILGTAQISSLCLTYRIVCQVHRLDVLRHLTLYRVTRAEALALACADPGDPELAARAAEASAADEATDGAAEAEAGAAAGAPSSLKMPPPPTHGGAHRRSISTDSAASDPAAAGAAVEQPFHYVVQQSRRFKCSHARGQLPYLRSFGPQCGWSPLDVSVVARCTSAFVADWVRICHAVSLSSRRFRLFLVMATLASALGALFSMWTFVTSVNVGRSSRELYSDVANTVPTLFNLFFALMAMVAAARISHSGDRVVATTAEFGAAVALSSVRLPDDPAARALLPDLKARCAALVTLFRVRPVYLSLYGLAVNRSLAFGVVSPSVALILFLVQRFLLSQSS